MTRMEQLQNKLKILKTCVDKTNGTMKKIWENRYLSLQEQIKNMTVKELSKEVEEYV